ncbi:hypothetical protein V5799_028968 [Amblyomma americanum]|uniref:Uncharacterized protein n=1 Tax=Amblyomma americanum TaxID=6943 RepID=A0AAQ4ESF2_AMBAM
MYTGGAKAIASSSALNPVGFPCSPVPTRYRTGWTTELSATRTSTKLSLAQNSQRSPSPARSAQRGGGPADNTRSHSPARAGSPDARTERRRRPDRPRTPAGSPNATYDYFILSQQWSPGICAADSQCIASSKKNYWTIHGLWPSGDSSSPSFCIDEQFNGRVLDKGRRMNDAKTLARNAVRRN